MHVCIGNWCFRWWALDHLSVIKLDTLQVICSVYGLNRTGQTTNMFSMLSLKLKVFKEKYKEAILIIGGDFNNDLDLWPPRTLVLTGFKLTSHPSDNLWLTDLWLTNEWKSPRELTLIAAFNRRIDSCLLSSQGLQFISGIFHCHAPVSDPKVITKRDN